jgi:hypothetical protein
VAFAPAVPVAVGVAVGGGVVALCVGDGVVAVGVGVGTGVDAT